MENFPLEWRLIFRIDRNEMMNEKIKLLCKFSGYSYVNFGCLLWKTKKGATESWPQVTNLSEYDRDNIHKPHCKLRCHKSGMSYCVEDFISH